MAPLSDVTISLSNGNLGRLPANQDGVAGIVLGPTSVAPSEASLNTPYLVRSLADAEALGITAAYDEANEVIAYHHIKEFFEEVGGAAPLWIILFNGLMTAYFDAAGPADKLQQSAGGDIRLVGAGYTPPTGAITATSGLPTAVVDTIADAKAFVARQFAAHKPCRVLLEGYGIASVAGLTLDLRDTAGPVADAVGVVIGQTSNLLPAGMSDFTRYASIGRVLGRAARIQVHYNLGRVKDGPLNNVVSAGFSNATSLSAATDAQLSTLNDLGYIFFRVITGLPGVYINDDHMATPITSDYSGLLRGRVIDKAARIAYNVYVNELNDDVELDGETGQLAISVVKNLEGIIESAIGTQMAGEISGVQAYIDPTQNILANDRLDIELNIVPRGVAKNIRVTLGYANPANA
jgi:hypothetical protein